MAITGVSFNSTDDIKDFLADTGFFREISSNGNGTYCKIDADEPTLSIPWSTSSSDQLLFRPNPNNWRVQVAINVWGPRFGYKTQNGVLLMTDNTQSGTSGFLMHCLIGQTNNGKVAVAMGSGQFPTSIKAVAYNEYGQNIDAEFSIGGTRWNDSPQFITAPIPTHPLTGTSYIKGSITLNVGPTVGVGVININGIDYITNGCFGISDEEFN
jgi:hypothetical protein